MAFDKIYKYSAYISMLSQVKDTTHGINFNMVWTPSPIIWPLHLSLAAGHILWHWNNDIITSFSLSYGFYLWMTVEFFPPIFLQITRFHAINLICLGPSQQSISKYRTIWSHDTNNQWDTSLVDPIPVFSTRVTTL